MNTFDITLRLTDSINIEASSEEEARSIAMDTFAHYDLTRPHELEVQAS